MSGMTDNRDKMSLKPASEQVNALVVGLEDRLAQFKKRETWLLQAACGEIHGFNVDRMRALVYDCHPDPKP